MIGIFDADLNVNPFGGKSLRLINIFKRMKAYHELMYFPIIPDGTVIPGYLEDLFDGRIKPIYYKPVKNSFRGKLGSILLQQPGFNYSITNRLLYEHVTTQIKNKCIENNVKVIHLFDFFIASFFEPFKQSYPIIWDIGDSQWLFRKRKEWFSKFSMNINRVRNYEFDHIKGFSATVFVGEADLKLYPASIKDKVVLIPNGVDEVFLNYDGHQGMVVPDTIIFTGNMAFPPNIDAVKHFYSNIYPKVKKIVPSLRWFIVGTNSDKMREMVNDDPDITTTGRVEDIRPYVFNSKVYVAPIRFGGGIKNKLLEAMALGKNIVAYDRAVDGFCKGYHIKVSANQDEFARDIIDALKAAPGSNNTNIEFVRKNYTWQLAIEKYKKLYSELLINNIKI